MGLKILVSGAGGLIGSALRPLLQAAGHTVAALRRGQTDTLEGASAVVHLAGENISAVRWTAMVKTHIRDSRVEGTQALCRALAALEHPPSVLVCASAVGYYGDRGDEILTEANPPGWSFLAGVCREWEAAAATAARQGIRVVNLRFGMVLSAGGGALARMLPVFRLGLGGPVGPGTQWWSWVSLEDAVRAVRHALSTESLRGPVNVVSPHPVTNREFARALGRVLHRPAIVPLPGFAANLALGGMADELLLSSARVDPGRLRDTGFQFQDAVLEPALRRILGVAAP